MFYTEKPKDFSPKLSAIGCFIEVDKEILLLLRNESKPQGGTWGMPAGKLESDESMEDGVLRETLEETGIQIVAEDLEYVAETHVRLPEYDWVYHIFKTKLNTKLKIQIDSKSHTKFGWFSPQEALKLSLLPGTGDCIKLTCE